MQQRNRGTQTTHNNKFEELKTEITKIKINYAEITTNKEYTNEKPTDKHDGNIRLQNMTKEITHLKSLIQSLCGNNVKKPKQ